MLGFSRQWVGWRLARILFVAVPVAVLLFFLYLWRLGTLVPGLSHAETTERTSSSSLNSIVNNPINAPHKVLQFFFQHFGHSGAFWMRLVSVFFALIFLLALFLILRKWFGNFVAVIGTLFLGCTPWIVILARNATSDIMLLSPILAVFAYTTLTRTKRWHRFIWFIFIVCIAISIYAPGAIWFVALTLVLVNKQIFKAVSSLSSVIIILGLAGLLLLLMPLFYGVYSHPPIGKELLLIPHNFAGWMETAKSFVWSLSSLFIKTRHHIDYTVGSLAILNIAQVILGLIGLYAMNKSAKREAYVAITLIVIGVIFASINQNIVLLTICFPAFAILDAAALRFLYIKWSRVFPLNPLPRALAVILISLLILAHVSYGVRYALAAWPHNQTTRKVYVLK
jgi:4-amino-4-deoxy-L-arabinose transferase-like glycosyltransferase